MDLGGAAGIEVKMGQSGRARPLGWRRWPQWWHLRGSDQAGPKTGPLKYDDNTFALPLLPTSTNTEVRKPDGSVTHKDKAGRFSFGDIVAILECTLTARLNSLEDTQRRSQPPDHKLLQLLNNVKSVLRQHQLADFALGFAIRLDMVYAVKVDNEVVTTVELKDCWKT
ncbi:BZ3500_MvSof-1268-A1-R1_Chr7-1g09049 [Microbotryum saponariae]|uniref:BZ3500_MvSof-1268-A1-R1_Chr7-1g09049 protein n=1 Tax=Microbotryum saponariae TaxID=289078 RepID=A0A2X0LTR9_9BASI|nr:BZ3501_MvSof-1269-A2-R1_Chr7-1g08753 [Microbotryum saponariae]SDA02693.1 BZ3500_MvSof-1268-A1-R1_Chr7-1g09049 [Microbotryum saponariae]